MLLDTEDADFYADSCETAQLAELVNDIPAFLDNNPFAVGSLSAITVMEEHTTLAVSNTLADACVTMPRVSHTVNFKDDATTTEAEKAAAITTTPAVPMGRPHHIQELVVSTNTETRPPTSLAPIDDTKMRAMTVFSVQKAGMNEESLKRINAIVFELSKDTPHFKNQQRKDALHELRIQRMLKQLKDLESAWARQPKELVQSLERQTMKKVTNLITNELCPLVEGVAKSTNQHPQQQPLQQEEESNSHLPCAPHSLSASASPSTVAYRLEDVQQQQQPSPPSVLVIPPRIIVYIDLDMFFAAVEARDRPELANVPFAVGGMGMLSTSNYHARRFGVRAAMPGFIAKKLCPELVLVKPSYQKYSTAAEEVRAVLREYDPNFSSYSLDEATLNLGPYIQRVYCTDQNPYNTIPQTDHKSTLTASEKDDTQDNRKQGNGNLPCNSTEAETETSSGRVELHHPYRKAPGTAQEYLEVAGRIVSELRAEVQRRTQLTCSAGIAPTRMLAKICSDVNKPNGQLVLEPTVDAVRAFMSSLPIRKIPGIGRVAEKTLAALGVKVCGDVLIPHTTLVLSKVLSPIMSEFVIRSACGLGDGFVHNDPSIPTGSAEHIGDLGENEADISKHPIDELKKRKTASASTPDSSTEKTDEHTKKSRDDRYQDSYSAYRHDCDVSPCGKHQKIEHQPKSAHCFEESDEDQDIPAEILAALRNEEVRASDSMYAKINNVYDRKGQYRTHVYEAQDIGTGPKERDNTNFTLADTQGNQRLFSTVSHDFANAKSQMESRIVLEPSRKSMSIERTFKATSDRTFLRDRLKGLALKLAEDVASENLQGLTLTLKVKLATFEVFQKSATFETPIYSESDLQLMGEMLLKGAFDTAYSYQTVATTKSPTQVSKMSKPVETSTPSSVLATSFVTSRSTTATAPMPAFRLIGLRLNALSFRNAQRGEESSRLLIEENKAQSSYLVKSSHTSDDSHADDLEETESVSVAQTGFDSGTSRRLPLRPGDAQGAQVKLSSFITSGNEARSSTTSSGTPFYLHGDITSTNNVVSMSRASNLSTYSDHVYCLLCCQRITHGVPAPQDDMLLSEYYSDIKAASRLLFIHMTRDCLNTA